MRCCAIALACAFAAGLFALPAAARRGGIAATGCNGCHQGGQSPGLRLLAMPANPAPGQTVAITLEIDAVNGPVGGFYLKLDGPGSLEAPAGSGIRSFTATELAHSAPKTASGGVVRFTFGWTAPQTPGGVIFRAWAVSGNGNDGSGGDGAGEAELLVAYGCTGELYPIDLDGDGFGASEFGQKRDCSLPAGYAQRDGDCAEYDVAIHPEAAELCNDKDDDCDGELDEALPIGPQYPDTDGDGYGAGAAADAIQDCSSPEGYAARRGDCNDRMATVHPDAAESCDYVDEDCDGRTDEGARAACGVGWCRRLADSCSLELCTPGMPRAEECNAFDDDCDDIADEDVVCAGGLQCVEGRCVAPGAVAAMGRDAGAPVSSGTGGGSNPSAAGRSAAAGADADAASNSPGRTSSSSTGCSAGSPRPVAPSAWLGLALVGGGLLARRRRTTMCRLIVGTAAATVVLACAAASARPPESTPAKRDAAADGAVVGEVRMRDRVVPLTRASLAEGGPAHELGSAIAADVMADIEHERWKAASDRSR